jgi:hypothetical protein
MLKSALMLNSTHYFKKAPLKIIIDEKKGNKKVMEYK